MRDREAEERLYANVFTTLYYHVEYITCYRMHIMYAAFMQR